jgi:hypothetical protein
MPMTNRPPDYPVPSTKPDRPVLDYATPRKSPPRISLVCRVYAWGMILLLIYILAQYSPTPLLFLEGAIFITVGAAVGCVLTILKRQKGQKVFLLFAMFATPIWFVLAIFNLLGTVILAMGSSPGPQQEAIRFARLSLVVFLYLFIGMIIFSFGFNARSRKNK